VYFEGEVVMVWVVCDVGMIMCFLMFVILMLVEVVVVGGLCWF